MDGGYGNPGSVCPRSSFLGALDNANTTLHEKTGTTKTAQNRTWTVWIDKDKTTTLASTAGTTPPSTPNHGTGCREVTIRRRQKSSQSLIPEKLEIGSISPIKSIPGSRRAPCSCASEPLWLAPPVLLAFSGLCARVHSRSRVGTGLVFLQ